MPGGEGEIRVVIHGPPIHKNMPTRTKWGQYVPGWRERKADFQAAFVAAMVNARFGHPSRHVGRFKAVYLVVRVFSRLPKTGHKDKALDAQLVPRTTKPDVDRHLNGVLDGLTALLYKDDVLVTRVDVAKRWLPRGDENERILLIVREDRVADDPHLEG